MSRIVVAFENEATLNRVREMLASASIPVRFLNTSGAEVIRSIRFMGGGIVICGAKFADMTADNLYEDLDGSAYMLVVGKPEQLDMCENDGIFKLPLPINRHDLSASVRILEQMADMDLRHRINQDEILKAKELLGLHAGMTEGQAHMYLQRKSMNAGVKMVNAAREIIEKYVGKE